MKAWKLSPGAFIGVLLALFFGVALYFRIYLPYDDIFTSVGIKFSGNDAYFYMRLVDNLAHNFPHLNEIDPYLAYPGGGWIGGILFFAWLLAGVTWIIGLGSPTQHLIDVVGVYFPAILGALTIIPVYFIGKNLFNRWTGVVCAALIAIMPGEFMGRSILGYTDHHVAESLFSAIVMLFLVLAIKSAGQRELTFAHLRRGDWAGNARTLTCALLAGVSLGIYLLTWIGGLLFVFVISVYLVVQFIIDHLRQRSTDYLGIIGFVLFLVAMIMFMASSPVGFYLASIIIALLVPLVLGGLSHFMAGRNLRPAYYPLALVGAGAIGLAIFYAIAPSLLGTMLRQFNIFSPSGPSTTTLEMQSLFSLGLALPWGNFTTGFFLSLAVLLGMLIYFVTKRQGSPEKALLVVWSLIILAAALGQRRFAYYFAVNVALLTGYFVWQTLWQAGLKKLAVKPVVAEKQAGRTKSKKKSPGLRLTASHVNVFLAAVIVLGLVIVPGIPAAIAVANTARFAPSDGWVTSLTWLRANSPEPFGNPDFYYQLYPTPPAGQDYSFPKTAYGVTAWWDYGYWITRIAHRLPTANPSQDPRAIVNVTQLFLSQEEAASEEVMQRLNSRYVVIDYATVISKFWAVVTWAGRNQTDFFDEYVLQLQDRPPMVVRLYYPEYYRSLSTRLFNFGAKAVTAESPIVISWEVRQNRGQSYKQIASAQSFTSYKDAAAFVQNQKSGNYRIVGNNPFISPITLEALKDYKLVYSSAQSVSHPDVGAVPEVKVFEYTGSRP